MSCGWNGSRQVPSGSCLSRPGEHRPGRAEAGNQLIPRCGLIGAGEQEVQAARRGQDYAHLLDDQGPDQVRVAGGELIGVQAAGRPWPGPRHGRALASDTVGQGFPHLARVPANSLDLGTLFEFGLQRILDGIAMLISGSCQPS
jgi:hypothetical protein